MQQLRTHFSKVSSALRGSTARQQAQAGAAAAAAAAVAAATAAAAVGSSGVAACPKAADTGAGDTQEPAGPGEETAAGVEAAATATGGSAPGAQQAWHQLFGGGTANVSKGASNRQQCAKQQPAKGSGKGGAGAANKCVPCTLVKMQQLIAAGELPAEQPLAQDAAKRFAGFVQATHQHHKQCPYCKCKDCTKFFSKRGPIDPTGLTLRKNCQGMKKQ